MVFQFRFTSFLSVDELKQANLDMLNLAYKLLKKQGVLIMKTMDIYYAGKQHWISYFVQTEAMKVGFELIDTFIMAAKLDHSKVQKKYSITHVNTTPISMFSKRSDKVVRYGCLQPKWFNVNNVNLTLTH